MPHRRVWIAAALSLVQPGAGQLFNGRPLRALGFACAAFVLMAALAVVVHAWWFAGLVAIVALSGVIAIAAVAEAARDAHRQGDAHVPRRSSSLPMVLGAMLVVFLLRGACANAIREHETQAFRIPSDVMSPTLLKGDYVFVDRRSEARAPRVGAVVVFGADAARGDLYIRRVAAVAGRTVELRDERGRADGAASGPIEASAIAGTVRGIYWSWDPDRHQPRWERIGRRVR